jgi:hypothetical protein
MYVVSSNWLRNNIPRRRVSARCVPTLSMGKEKKRPWTALTADYRPSSHNDVYVMVWLSNRLCLTSFWTAILCKVCCMLSELREEVKDIASQINLMQFLFRETQKAKKIWIYSQNENLNVAIANKKKKPEKPERKTNQFRDKKVGLRYAFPGGQNSNKKTWCDRRNPTSALAALQTKGTASSVLHIFQNWK